MLVTIKCSDVDEENRCIKRVQGRLFTPSSFSPKKMCLEEKLKVASPSKHCPLKSKLHKQTDDGARSSDRSTFFFYLFIFEKPSHVVLPPATASIISRGAEENLMLNIFRYFKVIHFSCLTPHHFL